MRVVVVDRGWVGVTTGACLALMGHRVTCQDIDMRKIEALAQGQLPFYEPYLQDLVRAQRAAGRLDFTTDPAAASEADAVFLAVATPSAPHSGAVDVRHVRAAAEALGRHLNHDRFCVVVNKSTVPVGSNGLVEKLVIEGINLKGEHTRVASASNLEFLREGSYVADALYPERIVIGTEDDRAGKKKEKSHTTTSR